MNVTKLALAAAVSALAFGVQAQTIETDYPAVVAGGPVVSVEAQAPEGTRESNEPLLVQSNYAGPEVNPGRVDSKASPRTREEVQSEAELLVPRSPGLNA